MTTTTTTITLNPLLSVFQSCPTLGPLGACIALFTSGNKIKFEKNEIFHTIISYIIMFFLGLIISGLILHWVVFNYITNGIYEGLIVRGLIVALTLSVLFWIINYYLPSKKGETNKEETPTPTIPTSNKKNPSGFIHEQIPMKFFNKECFDSSESKTTIHSALS